MRAEPCEVGAGTTLVDRSSGGHEVESKRPAAAAQSTHRSLSGSPWADRLLADLKPIDFVQFCKKLDEDDPGDMRHVVSRLSTSSLVKYGEFLEIDTTSMSREELIEELLMQVDRAPFQGLPYTA